MLRVLEGPRSTIEWQRNVAELLVARPGFRPIDKGGQAMVAWTGRCWRPGLCLAEQWR